MMFESWTNSVLPFSKTSHSQAEKDKMANVIAMFIAGLSFYIAKMSLSGNLKQIMFQMEE